MNDSPSSLKFPGQNGGPLHDLSGGVKAYLSGSNCQMPVCSQMLVQLTNAKPVSIVKTAAMYD